MNLRKLTLENFKCFQKKIDLDFGRITFLTGANSSGKSSIIYGILGAIQSGEFPLQFSTNGKYVNMGDFKEIVYNHHSDEKIKIGFVINIDNNLIEIDTVWEIDNSNFQPKLFELDIKTDYFQIKLLKVNSKYSINYKYDASKEFIYEKLYNEAYIKYINIITSIIGSLKNINNNISEIFSNSLEIKNIFVDDLIFFNNTNKLFENQNINIHPFLRDILFTINLFTNYDENMNFISSFRLHPERTYLEQTKTKLKVDRYGEGYLDQIIAWETKKDKKFEQLISILQELSLLENIKSKRLEGGRYEITVQVKKEGVHTSLNDVGFGISQFLPIIVSDLQLSNDSTLFVAQPEIHLHPSIQSLFGDYLVNQVKSTSKNYVIETHSEYLLNKIRLAIVKKEINAEDVKVYYIDNQVEGNEVYPITFNDKGQIINAPDNFFKTYMMDVMEIAINAVE
jgi:predicted ATPase